MVERLGRELPPRAPLLLRSAPPPTPGTAPCPLNRGPTAFQEPFASLDSRISIRECVCAVQGSKQLSLSRSSLCLTQSSLARRSRLWSFLFGVPGHWVVSRSSSRKLCVSFRPFAPALCFLVFLSYLSACPKNSQSVIQKKHKLKPHQI